MRHAEIHQINLAFVHGLTPTGNFVFFLNLRLLDVTSTCSGDGYLKKGETKNKNYKIEYIYITRINRILYRVGYTTMPFRDKWTYRVSCFIDIFKCNIYIVINQCHVVFGVVLIGIF